MQLVPQCVRCARLRPEGTCAAFAGPVPEAIATNRVEHTMPFPGDRGLTFLARDPLVKALDALLVKYDPDQPRDDVGRWTDVGGAGSYAARAARLTERPTVTEELKAEALRRMERPSDPVQPSEGFAFPSMGTIRTALKTPEERTLLQHYEATLDTVPALLRDKLAEVKVGLYDSRLMRLPEAARPAAQQAGTTPTGLPEFNAAFSTHESTDETTIAIDPFMEFESRVVGPHLNPKDPEQGAADYQQYIMMHEQSHAIDHFIGQRLLDEAKASQVAMLVQMSPERYQKLHRGVMLSEHNPAVKQQIAMAVTVDLMGAQVGGRGAEMAAAVTHGSLSQSLERPAETFADAITYLRGAKMIRSVPRATYAKLLPSVIQVTKDIFAMAKVPLPRAPRIRKADDPLARWTLDVPDYEVRTPLGDGAEAPVLVSGKTGGHYWERLEYPSGITKYREDQPRDTDGKWVTMYHGTTARAAGSIRRKGLMVSGKPPVDMSSDTSHVYLTSSYQDAEGYARNVVDYTGRGKPAVVEVRVPKSQLKTFQRRKVPQLPGVVHYARKKSIPSSWIVKRDTAGALLFREALAKYREDQERDDRGRWVDEGGGGLQQYSEKTVFPKTDAYYSFRREDLPTRIMQARQQRRALHGKLRKAQAKALSKEEQYLLAAWTGPSFPLEINAYFRGEEWAGRAGVGSLYWDRRKGDATALGEALARAALPEDLKLYRGEHAEWGARKPPRVGSTVRDPGIVSTSTMAEAGHRFTAPERHSGDPAGANNAMVGEVGDDLGAGSLFWRIRAPKGTPALATPNSAEAEVILAPGTPLKVLKVTRVNVDYPDRQYGTKATYAYVVDAEVQLPKAKKVHKALLFREALAKYRDDQARDDRGRWMDEGGGGTYASLPLGTHGQSSSAARFRTDHDWYHLLNRGTAAQVRSAFSTQHPERPKLMALARMIEIHDVKRAHRIANELTVDTRATLPRVARSWLHLEAESPGSRLWMAKPLSYAEASRFVRGAVGKYDENQPRVPSGSPEGGQWTDGDAYIKEQHDAEAKAGGAAPSDPAALAARLSVERGYERRDAAGRALLQEAMALSIPERKAKFETPGAAAMLDAVADAPRGINRRMLELVSNAGDWDAHNGPFEEAVMARAKDWAAQGVIPEDQAEPLARYVTALHSDLTEAGANPAVALELSRRCADLLAAQEAESVGRSLGDHGIRHLTQDADTALDALRALPGEEEYDPKNRALLRIAGAVHDTGYLTAPSRVFLDGRHPQWGQQFYDANLRGLVGQALGADKAGLLSEVIRTHAGTDFNFDTEAGKLASAFRLSDNLALFQYEKLPALVRYVPANTKVLAALGRGEVTVEAARATMLTNLKAVPDLQPRLRRQITRAIGEVSPILPKLSLGMYGGRYEGMRWESDALEVDITRTSNRSTFMQRIGDFGYRQFKKLAETYLGDKDPVVSQVVTGTGFEIKDRRTGRGVIRFRFSRAA